LLAAGGRSAWGDSSGLELGARVIHEERDVMGNTMRTMRGIAIALALLASSVMTPRVVAGLLNPAQYASLGPLPDEAGTYRFGGGATPVLTLPDGRTIQGVTDPTGQIGVFTFDSVVLSHDPNIVVYGAAALLSQGNMTLEGISVSATSSAEGPGAGGTSMFTGGGGGYGGNGGNGGSAGPFGVPWLPNPYPGGWGGSSYGGMAAGLQAGSAGGGSTYLSGGGGSGGGAVEFGTEGALRMFSVSVFADGSKGGLGAGGGSGGAIGFYGGTISGYANISARGGDGGAGVDHGGPSGFTIGGGGGGGGGRIEIEGGATALAMSVDLSGGRGGWPPANLFDVQVGAAGGMGVMQTMSVPEPAGIILASTALVLLMGFGTIHRP
jgi:hypothetical protein